MRMRRILTVLGGSTLVAACGGSSAPAPAATTAEQRPVSTSSPAPTAPFADARTNFLANGTFEEDDASDWQGFRPGAPGHSSPRALLLENHKPEWNAATQWVRFSPNRPAPAKVLVSGWIRTENVARGAEDWMKAGVIVDFTGADGQQVGGWQRAAVDVLGTSDWTFFEWTYSLPEGARAVRLDARLPNVVGKVWFDDLSLALLEADGTRRVDDGPRQQTTDTSDWYAYAPPKIADGTSLDLSFLNEKPAGKHGHVQVARGHFAFADGTPVRFWGTNLVGASAFPSHEVADSLARRLARLGVNLVRLHHMDAFWAKPNVFDPSRDDTQKLAEDSLDKLDYLISRLKNNGIYIYPDLLVHRKYRKGDGIADFAALEPGAKGVAHFDRRVIDLNALYAKELFGHKNKYTGASLAEDPVMVGTEIVNESTIFLNGFGDDPFPPSYEAERQQLYESAGGKAKAARFGYDWGGEKLKIVEHEESAAETMTILAGLEDASNAEMRSRLRALGAKSLLTGSNIGLRIFAEIRANAKMDFMDTHHYWDHPQVWRMPGSWDQLEQAPFDNQAQLRDPSKAAPTKLATWAVKDKPLLVTEWNDCFPNEYRLEGPMLMTAYGSLQDWDGMLQFNYGLELPGSIRMHPFGIHSRPDNEALFEIGALLFRSRYLLASPEQIVEDVDDATALTPPSLGPLLVDSPWLPYVARVAKRFVGSAAPKAPSLDGVRSFYDPNGRTIRSSTGQIVWRYGEATLVIDSPKAQGFTGNLANGDHLDAHDLSVTVDPRNPWASIVLASLDGKPIPEASRLVLLAVARAENTGQRYNRTRTALQEPGRAPVLLQGVKADVLLKGSAGQRLTVRPLDASGVEGAPLRVQRGTQGASFRLAPSDRSALYLVVRER